MNVVVSCSHRQNKCSIFDISDTFSTMETLDLGKAFRRASVELWWMEKTKVLLLCTVLHKAMNTWVFTAALA